MGLLQTHLDVLQNIEFVIVKTREEEFEMSDYDVMEALDGTISVYRAESRGHEPKEVTMDEPAYSVFRHLKILCEWRLGRSQDPNSQEALPALTSIDDLLACLRKVRRTVEKWNNRGGRYGYLTFISQSVGRYRDPSKIED